jgi:hypothetical protein
VSRAARGIARNNADRYQLTVLGLERELAEATADKASAERLKSLARQLQRAYAAWAQASASAAMFYREHSGARSFADSTAFALNRIAGLMQAEIERVWGGA